MMNTTMAKTIYDLANQFSGSKYVNWTICVRAIKAVREKSLEGLCEPITYETIDATFKKVEYTMDSKQVENRLKEIGLYQLITSNLTKVTPEFREMLDKELIGSFGHAEVEGEIRKRAIEAVEQGNIQPLIKAIDMEWRNGSCVMSEDAVMKKLYEKGILQLVVNEISKQK